MTTKIEWVSVKERLPESSEEVLVYSDVFDLLTYFKKGAVMDYAINISILNPEIKLLDSIFNKENEIKALEDGFYIYDNVTGECGWRKHANNITHWAKMPEPPEVHDD
jgi:hypothetical protein